jgi:hypothetical protein
MTQKKVCMLGGFAVGKTSLVARYVRSIFSEKYLSTVGVKVDKKVIEIDGHPVTMMLWDLFGQDDFQTVRDSHLRGMSGYLLVADGTRRDTLDMARVLQEKAVAAAGRPLPFLLLLNKADLAAEWEIDAASIQALTGKGWRVVRTSAKSGEGVDVAFDTLTRSMLADSAASRTESQ